MAAKAGLAGAARAAAAVHHRRAAGGGGAVPPDGGDGDCGVLPRYNVVAPGFIEVRLIN